MRKFLLALFITFSTLTLSASNDKYEGENPSKSAYATSKGVEGTVIKEGKNEWFIIKTSKQYVVIEAQGLNNFSVNEKVYGDFYGFNGRKVYNDTKKKSYTVWVEGYFSSYDQAVKYMNKKD